MSDDFHAQPVNSTTLDTNAELLTSYEQQGTSVGEGVIRLSGQGYQTGQHGVYVTRATLRRIVSVPTGHEDVLDLCCIVATNWVRYRVGEMVLADDVNAMPPYDLVEVPVNAGRKRAAEVVAARVWASPQAPYGILGGLGDEAIYTTMRIPEAEVLLIGQRTGFGLA